MKGYAVLYICIVKNFSITKYFKGKKPIEAFAVALIHFLCWGTRRIVDIGLEIAVTAIHLVLGNGTKICKSSERNRS